MELLGRIAGSATVRDCLARHWFEYAFSRHHEPTDACALAPLSKRFQQSGDLVELAAGLARSESFRHQLIEE
jgi:hypothetical protein